MPRGTQEIASHAIITVANATLTKNLAKTAHLSYHKSGTSPFLPRAPFQQKRYVITKRQKKGKPNKKASTSSFPTRDVDPNFLLTHLSVACPKSRYSGVFSLKGRKLLKFNVLM